ncbi:GerAB/ArcD/ProY family transporter [Paenibacillus harenae]|uniref:GerAB/ArcD/ProY family transporter n=1 Tax=Paenibacillus harenae TaxID=306543 RepID=UPI0004039BA6|nr:endospore germination permease [Paenibacillus harenae]
MANNVKISLRQFTVLIMFYTIGTTILVIPAPLAADAGQHAWIAAIVGWLLGLLVVVLYVSLGKLFPQMTFIAYIEHTFGKWLGKPISLFFIFFSFVTSSIVLYYIGNFMTTQIMPETPIGAFVILFAGIVLMGLRLGLEVLARTAEILFPWFLLLFTTLTLFLIPEIEIQKIRPIIEIGFKPVIRAALVFAGTASLPMVVFLMIYPMSLNEKKGAGKAFYTGTLIGGIFIIIITFLSVSILGAELSAKNMYPSYALSKKINVGNFIQRVEILMAGLWFLTIFFKATFYAYGFISGIAQVFGCKDYRPFVIPCGMIMIAFSLVVYPDVVYMSDFESTVYIPFVISAGLLLPLFVLITGLIRKRMMNNQGVESDDE